MKKLKGCLIIWVLFLAIGYILGSILESQFEELGNNITYFFSFFSIFSLIIGLIIFSVFTAIFGVVDYFQSGTAKQWWDAAKEGKTISEKQNEKKWNK
ncbi:MAG TPA: hypothetical protein PL041_05300 [Melioribacteraceae bacterium]|nr:hypothetical protein [Melioribacteraceae bacterium]